MIATQKLARRFLQLLLLVGDALGLYIIFILALTIRLGSAQLPNYSQQLLEHWRFATVFAIIAGCQYIFDLYEPRHWRSSLFSPFKIIVSQLAALPLLLSWFYFFAEEATGVFGRGVLLGTLFGFTFFSLLFRYIISRSQNLGASDRQWLLIGQESSYQSLLKDSKKSMIRGDIVFLDRSSLREDLSALKEKLTRRWTAIIVDSVLNEEANRVLMNARLSGQVVMSIPNFYEFYCGKVPVRSLEGSWFAYTEGFSIIHSQSSVRLKRVFDIVISIVLLILCAPLLFAAGVCIWLTDRGPIFYSQVRVGNNGQLFTLWKLRSMCLNAENPGEAKWAQKKDSRVTWIGRIIRKTRIDEIPQLWNILKGDMSFIGPRPERPEFTAVLGQKIPFYELRHLVKPGLTGWAQVMYPYGASEEDALEKLQFDLFYIKNYSFLRDMEIVLKTISVVLFGAGR